MRYDRTIRFLIRDGAGQFIAGFDEVFRSDGTTIIRTPPYTPVANAYAERWVGTVRRELLDRTLIWNRRHLEQLLRDYVEHYNTHRPHRSLGQRAPDDRRRRRLPARPTDPTTPHLRRTHQRVPPSSLNHPDNGHPIARTSLRRARLSDRMPRHNPGWSERTAELVSGTHKVQIPANPASAAALAASRTSGQRVPNGSRRISTFIRRNARASLRAPGTAPPRNGPIVGQNTASGSALAAVLVTVLGLPASNHTAVRGAISPVVIS